MGILDACAVVNWRSRSAAKSAKCLESANLRDTTRRNCAFPHSSLLMHTFSQSHSPFLYWRCSRRPRTFIRQPNSGKMTLLIAILTFFSTTSSSEWPQQSLSSMSGKGVRTETARWTRNTNAGWESHDGGFKMEFIVSAVSDCVYVFAIIYTGSRKNKATRTKFKLKMKRSNVQLDFEFWAHTSIACEASVSVRVLYLFRCSSAWTFAPVPKYAR